MMLGGCNQTSFAFEWKLELLAPSGFLLQEHVMILYVLVGRMLAGMLIMSFVALKRHTYASSHKWFQQQAHFCATTSASLVSSETTML